MEQISNKITALLLEQVFSSLWQRIVYGELRQNENLGISIIKADNSVYKRTTHGDMEVRDSIQQISKVAMLLPEQFWPTPYT
jgi:glutaminase